MATFERLPSGRWRARVEVRSANGQRRRISRTADTKRELRRLVAELELHGAPSSSSTTVAELFDAWLDGPARTRMRDGTHIGVESKWRSLLEPRVGHLTLEQLTAGHLDAAYADMLAAGAAPGSVRRAHVVMAMALRQAHRWGLVRSLVTADASPPPERRGDLNPPTSAEVRQLLEAAAVLAEGHVDRNGKRHPPRPWWPAWLRLAAATGARRGEVLGARFEDVVGLEWRISRVVAVQRGGDRVSADAKTSASIRTIALDRATVDELERWRSFLGRSSGWCWPGARDDVPLGRNAVDQAWRRTLELADLGRRVRLHDLRHAHATTLLSEGFDVRTVAGRLGHANPATLLRVYAAWMPARDEAAAGRIGELLR